MSNRALMLWIVSCCSFHVNPSYGNYASVLSEQLDLYCDSRGTKTPSLDMVKVGKAGPRGLPGRIGEPGRVNYTHVQHLLTSNLQELKLEEKIINLTKRLTVLEEEVVKSSNTDCGRAMQENAKIWNETGGIFDLYIGRSKRKIEAYCDTTTDGGGWMVIQRRMDGSENFYRNWADYVAGFGQPQGEFWIGLENLHRITTQEQVELRVDVEDWKGNKAYARYTIFSVGDASSKYTLRVGGYSGTAGDAMEYHNGQKFSAKDQDNDPYSSHCAVRHQGAWWYKTCQYTNLNGKYIRGGKYSGSAPYGIEWYQWKRSYWKSLKFVEMKMRPKH